MEDQLWAANIDRNRYQVRRERSAIEVSLLVHCFDKVFLCVEGHNGTESAALRYCCWGGISRVSGTRHTGTHGGEGSLR